MLTEEHVKLYLQAVYLKTKDTRLEHPNVEVVISEQLRDACIITSLGMNELLTALDFKPNDLTIEALESFLAELRSIFWLNMQGFVNIRPQQARKERYPDFLAALNGKDSAIETFCLTQVHGQKKDEIIGVYKNFDINRKGSKANRDFVAGAVKKKKQIENIDVQIRVILCVINSSVLVSLSTREGIERDAELMFKSLNWGKGYHVGIIVGNISVAYPKIIPTPPLQTSYTPLSPLQSLSPLLS